MLREFKMRLTMRELQRQCMGYRADPEQIVYDDNPKTLHSLRESDAGLGWYKAKSQPRGRTHIGRQVAPLSQYCNLPGGFPMPVFLHGRTDSRGRQRLTLVHLAERVEDAAELTMTFTLASHAPITPWGYPKMQASDCRLVVPGVPNTTPMRFYAGQPDPEDRSRFSLTFEIDGTRSTINGILNDDGSIKLRMADGPGQLSPVAR